MVNNISTIIGAYIIFTVRCYNSKPCSILSHTTGVGLWLSSTATKIKLPVIAECLLSLCIVSRNISTSTFKLVFPTCDTFDINSANEPAGIASLKSTLSDEIVTNGLRQNGWQL